MEEPTKVEKPNQTPSIPESQTKREGVNIPDLVNSHLLAVRYHVYQHIDVDTRRETGHKSFAEPIVSFEETHRFNSERKLPPFAAHMQATKKYGEILQFLKHRYSGRYFMASDGQKAQLGAIALAKVRLKGGFGVVIQGAFSSESNPSKDYSKRRYGRTGYDDQIIFKFDSQDAANDFYNYFEDEPFDGNPAVVEHNTKIIEDTMKTVLDSETYETVESSLFLGLEVKKF